MLFIERGTGVAMRYTSARRRKDDEKQEGRMHLRTLKYLDVSQLSPRVLSVLIGAEGLLEARAAHGAKYVTTGDLLKALLGEQDGPAAMLFESWGGRWDEQRAVWTMPSPGTIRDNPDRRAAEQLDARRA